METVNPLPEFIVELWHPTKNLPLLSEQVTAGSGKKVWWQCDKGHEWERTVKEQYKHPNCPYCSGSKVLPGFNDLATIYPKVAAEWHPTLNNGWEVSTVAPGSNKKAWWLCPQGHEYYSNIGKRTNAGKGCPVCANKTIIIGVNDLATLNPELVNEWGEENSFTPKQVVPGSHKKAWWSCPQGHKWETAIRKRAIEHQSCPYCSGNKVKPGFNDLKTLHPNLAEQWHDENIHTPDMFTAGSEHKAKWKCDKGHEWFTNINNRSLRNSNCPLCVAGEQASKAEQQIANYLKSLNITIQQHVKNIINPYEVDIYLPEHHIGVEYNGVYWHSEAAGKDKKYHYNKWLACKEKGVQLIQIWEDDYVRNPEFVKRMLAHKLGVSSSPRMYARKTEIVDLTVGEAQTFLNKNHIQGFVSGTYYIGLQHDNSTVAVLVLKQEPNNTLNIVRYATSLTVVGGFTKLLSYSTKTYKPKQYITFSDNTVSDGGLYSSNGFEAVAELKPDYMYVVKGQRKHKFGYRLKKFRNDPTLKYVEGLTEKELAQLNGIPRVWDAGKTKWVKTIILNK